MTGALLKSVDANPENPSVLFENLVPGTYFVTAIGYISTEPVSFSAHAGVSIKAGDVAEQLLTPVSVSVSPDSGNPLFGTLSIPVSWVTDIDADSILLVNSENKEIASVSVESGKREALLEARTIVGEQTVRLRILKNAEILYEGQEETLTVFSGSVSSPEEGAYLNLEFAKANPVNDFSVLPADKNNELTVSFTVPSNLDTISSAKLTLSDGTEKEISMNLLQSFSGKPIWLSFKSLESDSEYTAALTFTRTDGSTTLSAKATGRTLIDAKALEIQADNLTPAVGDAINFSYSVTPSNASDLGLCWKSSDESVLAIDEDGKAVALKAGTATVTCALTNKGLRDSLSVSITKPESAIRSERTEYGISLSWDPVKNATGYKVEYAFGNDEYSLLATSNEACASHTFTPITGSKLSYRIWALFFDGSCSALVGTESLTMEANDPTINLENPTLPESSLITISGIREGQCLSINASLSLSVETAETDAAITWYINMEKAGEGESFILNSLSPGLDFSTEEGSQRLTVTVITPGKALSRSLNFCMKADETVNNNPEKGGI
jgi:Bacterial Ig-like domain (group 2).